MLRSLTGKPRIFIGSSSRSYGMVKWLAEQIRSHELAIPIEWRSGGFAPSKSTLQNLIDQCKLCDFAVIFFTRDDEKSNPDRNSSDPLKIFKGPRDNTIFEAGLFVGGLGLQAERCILVSTVDESALPSDLRGITYIKIQEPPQQEPPYDRLDEAWCWEHLQKVLESVVYSVNTYGEFLYRPLLKILTKNQLAEREQVGKGCLEKYDKVVINSSEPEDCCEFVLAQAVAENLKEHIYYDYHFRLNEDNKENICAQWIDLIRILLATSCITDEYSEGDLKSDKDIKDFLKIIEKDENTLSKAFDNLKKQLRFYIHKQKDPLPFRINVHNVSSPDKAKCYLRHEDFYVEWFFKGEARDAVAILGSDSFHTDNSNIFQNTNTFKILNCNHSVLNNNSDTSNEQKNSFAKEKTKEIVKKFKNMYGNFENVQDVNVIINSVSGKLDCLNLEDELSREASEVRQILMLKIIDLFPDSLCNFIVKICFGEKNEDVNKEWNEISKGYLNFNYTKQNISSIMRGMRVKKDYELSREEFNTITRENPFVYYQKDSTKRAIPKDDLNKHVKDGTSINLNSSEFSRYEKNFKVVKSDLEIEVASELFKIAPDIRFLIVQDDINDENQINYLTQDMIYGIYKYKI